MNKKKLSIDNKIIRLFYLNDIIILTKFKNLQKYFL